jgi:hypothetical protein
MRRAAPPPAPLNHTMRRTAPPPALRFPGAAPSLLQGGAAPCTPAGGRAALQTTRKGGRRHGYGPWSCFWVARANTACSMQHTLSQRPAPRFPGAAPSLLQGGAAPCTQPCAGRLRPPAPLNQTMRRTAPPPALRFPGAAPSLLQGGAAPCTQPCAGRLRPPAPLNQTMRRTAPPPALRFPGAAPSLLQGGAAPCTPAGGRAALQTTRKGGRRHGYGPWSCFWVARANTACSMQHTLSQRPAPRFPGAAPSLLQGGAAPCTLQV